MNLFALIIKLKLYRQTNSWGTLINPWNFFLHMLAQLLYLYKLFWVVQVFLLDLFEQLFAS